MRMTVRYHDLADLELRETSKYYESEVTSLGRPFFPKWNMRSIRSGSFRRPLVSFLTSFDRKSYDGFRIA